MKLILTKQLAFEVITVLFFNLGPYALRNGNFLCILPADGKAETLISTRSFLKESGF